MEQIAVAWLVLDLTDSPTMVGLVFGARSLPSLFLSPLGGVIADRADFDWACEVLRERRIDPRATPVHLSPVHGVLDPRQLAEWILSERPDVRLHLQLHKFIWGPEARGV